MRTISTPDEGGRRPMFIQPGGGLKRGGDAARAGPLALRGAMAKEGASGAQGGRGDEIPRPTGFLDHHGPRQEPMHDEAGPDGARTGGIGILPHTGTPPERVARKYVWPPHMDPGVKSAIGELISIPSLGPAEGGRRGHPEYRHALELLALALEERSRGRMLRDNETCEFLHAADVAATTEMLRARVGMPFYVTWAALFHDALEDHLFTSDELFSYARDRKGEAARPQGLLYEAAAVVAQGAEEAEYLARETLKLVNLLTRDKRFGYADYLRYLCLDGRARLIKTADRDSNQRMTPIESVGRKTSMLLRELENRTDATSRELALFLRESARSYGVELDAGL